MCPVGLGLLGAAPEPGHCAPTGQHVVGCVEVLGEATTVPPITPRGLAAIKLPAIISRGLRDETRARRRMASDELVTGIGRDDELAFVYLGAAMVGENPTQAVATHYGIGRSAAAQRVRRARLADPPTLPPLEGDS